MAEPWKTSVNESCVVVSVNGREEKVNKGTIADLGSFISAKAAGAGIGKASVYIDGTEVEPDEIDNYSVNEIKKIDIKTYDIVRVC